MSCSTDWLMDDCSRRRPRRYGICCYRPDFWYTHEPRQAKVAEWAAHWARLFAADVLAAYGAHGTDEVVLVVGPPVACYSHSLCGPDLMGRD